MIETTVIDYLTEQLDGIPVVAETPRDVPAKYVRIEKTGSGERNKLLHATITAQSTVAERQDGGALLEAAELNEAVKAAMRGLISLTNVFRCDCQGDYNFTDTRLKNRRYQAVFDIYYMEG